MGPLGAQEMFFIALLALLLFGPKKLPELGRMLGKGLTEFRRAKNELKTTFDSHMQELEREAKFSELSQTLEEGNPSRDVTNYSSASYPYPYDDYGRQDSSYESPAGYPEIVSAPVSEPDHAGSASGNSAESQASPHPEPVPGTVPRSKPASSGEPVSISIEEDRPA